MTPTITRRAEYRPWGHFDQFTHNTPSTVKILTIESGQSLSLQYHNNRMEYWYILEGNPVIRLRDREFYAMKGEEFMIAKKELHRVRSEKGLVRILEIALGDFSEDDIVRTEDLYGR